MIKKLTKILQICHRRLSGNDGISYPFVVCITLVLLVFTFGIFEIIRVNIITSNVRDKFQAAIISETTDNYSNMYQPVRDGYAAGYSGEDSGWAEISVTTRNRIRNTLNDYFNDGEHGQVTVQSVDYTVEMTPIAPSDAENAVQYNLQGKLVIIIPYKFLWVDLPPIRQTVTVNSKWRQMF